jgi:D-alanine-D-alanine ligase-like ATP-grasp enzyme
MSRKKYKKEPILASVLRAIAPRLGITIIFEPEWGIVGQISYRSGIKRYFRYSTLDINHMGASEVARDKDYANFFMKGMGYPTIPGKAFYSDEWAKIIGSRQNIDAAYRFACKIGFPVFVKPNSKSQGQSVEKVRNKNEFYKAMKGIFKIDRVALVEQVVGNKDYRVVVLDNKIISAYQRIPLNVVGNGRATISGLLKMKQKDFNRTGRDTQLKLDDRRLILKLKEQGMTLKSMPTKGATIFLLDNANLSQGGDSVDVTEHIHPHFAKIAINLTKDMGLRLCGVDFMIEGDISEKPDIYHIIEINSAPGLDHYAQIGEAQQKKVEDLYFEVLKAMEK